MIPRLLTLLPFAVAVLLFNQACEPNPPPSPTPEVLEVAWSVCRTALEEALARGDFEQAGALLDGFSAEIELADASGSASGAALLRARQHLDDGRRQLAMAQEEQKLNQIADLVDRYIDGGSFDQARFFLELYLNSNHPSTQAEARLAALRDRVDAAEAATAPGTPQATPTSVPTPPAVSPGGSAPTVHGLRFVHIPAGTYRVGSPEGEPGRDLQQDLEPMSVYMEAFFISTTEVTQEAFTAVILRSWSRYVHSQRPAHSLSYGEAEEYCAKLTTHNSGFEFSLPSELEWEVACRAGRDPDDGPIAAESGDMDRFLRGVDAATQALQRYALFQPNHLQSGPAVVAQKLPNPFGIYDMHGNAAEWCRRAEQISSSYTGMLLKQPIRGGSVLSEYARCRAGARAFEPADSHRATIGFRVIYRRQ